MASCVKARWMTLSDGELARQSLQELQAASAALG